MDKTKMALIALAMMFFGTGITEFIAVGLLPMLSHRCRQLSIAYQKRRRHCLYLQRFYHRHGLCSPLRNVSQFLIQLAPALLERRRRRRPYLVA